jgi:hypothetical protein
MPPKNPKLSAPARRSARLTPNASEQTDTDSPFPSTETAEEFTEEEPEERPRGPQTRSKMAGSPSKEEQRREIADLKATVARLEALLTGQQQRPVRSPPRRFSEEAERDERRTRQSTPAESAFGGTKFRPTGMAAWPQFTPFAGNEGKNPGYDDRAKARAKDPPAFEGKEDDFDQFVQDVADKFEEDENTFRAEKSRMAYLMGCLAGGARETLGTRYRSRERPYAGVAEMIQALEAAYHDPNQSSTARDQLSKLRFTPGKKMNIHQFISKFNALATKANVPVEDWKITLWEHLPKNLDTRLLKETRDLSISYEEFCQTVASAAFSVQRAWEDRQETRKKEERATPRNENRGQRKKKEPDKERATSADKGRALSTTEMERHKRDGTCFTCGQKGHLSWNCPQKEASVKAVGSEKKEKEVEKARPAETSSDESGKD